MDFEIDDQNWEPGDFLPNGVTKILEIVRSMPDGKLYTTRRIAREINYGEGTVNKFLTHPALSEYKIKAKDHHGRRNLFGNAQTIRAYKQEVGEVGLE